MVPEGFDEGGVPGGGVPVEGGGAAAGGAAGPGVSGVVERSREWTGVGAVPSEWTAPASWAEQVRARRREKAVADTHAARVGTRVAPPMRGDGWRLTDADEAVLRALARYGVLSWRQVRDRFYGGHDRVTTRRLGYLVEAGWVSKSRDDGWAGVVLWPTRAGVSVISDRLPVPVSAPRSHPGERLLHALCVADVGLRFESRGVQVLTEREVRFLEGKPGENASLFASVGVPDAGEVDGAGLPRRLAVPVGAKGRVHYPDLVTVTAGGMVAVEVEVTPKTPQRLNEVVRAFMRSRQYGQVVYFGTDQVASQLTGGVNRVTGEWVDGALAAVQAVPSGPWTDDPAGRFRVRPLNPADEGVAYRLDMRQARDGMWVPKPAWRRLRGLWAADGDMGKPMGVPFLRWWHDVYRPVEEAAQRDVARVVRAQRMEA